MSSIGRDRSPINLKRSVPKENRVFIANIPYEMNWQSLKDLIRDEVAPVAHVEIFKDGNKSRGCGVVEFNNADDAKTCIEKMHKYELAGRSLIVKQDSNEVSSRGRGGGNNDRGRRDQGRDRLDYPPASYGSYSNDYGLSATFLHSLGIQPGTIGRKVFVSNLVWDVDEKKMREVFSLAGKVLNCELNEDKDGKSRGHGVVEFTHPLEAIQAISMLNNQKLYERSMMVRMDKECDESGMPKKLPSGLATVGMGLGRNGIPIDVTNIPRRDDRDQNVSSEQSGMDGNASSLVANILAGLVSNNSSGMQPSVGMANPLSNNMMTNSSYGGGMGLMGNAPRTGGGGMFDSTLMRNPLSGRNDGYGGKDLMRGEKRMRMSPDISPRTGRSKTIVVRNLPKECTWKLLQEQFNNFGAIQYTEMTGVSTGVIKYENDSDAEAAMKIMNGKWVGGKNLEISYY